MPRLDLLPRVLTADNGFVWNARATVPPQQVTLVSAEAGGHSQVRYEDWQEGHRELLHGAQVGKYPHHLGQVSGAMRLTCELETSWPVLRLVDAIECCSVLRQLLSQPGCGQGGLREPALAALLRTGLTEDNYLLQGHGSQLPSTVSTGMRAPAPAQPGSGSQWVAEAWLS